MKVLKILGVNLGNWELKSCLNKWKKMGQLILILMLQIPLQLRSKWLLQRECKLCLQGTQNLNYLSSNSLRLNKKQKKREEEIPQIRKISSSLLSRLAATWTERDLNICSCPIIWISKIAGCQNHSSKTPAKFLAYVTFWPCMEKHWPDIRFLLFFEPCGRQEVAPTLTLPVSTHLRLLSPCWGIKK